MTMLVQITAVATVVLAVCLQSARSADPSVTHAKKIPLVRKPHPDHEKYLGWPGIEWMERNNVKIRTVERQTKQRFRAARDIPAAKNWRAIRFVGTEAVGEVNWSPALLVKVRHTKPDAINIAKRGLLIDRHINPKAHFKNTSLVTRNATGRDEAVDGVAVSIESMPGGRLYVEGDGKTVHQRDWDFLVKTRNRIWAQSGIKDSDPTLKKLKALAEYVRQRQYLSHWSYSVHPVDYLTYATYCTGRANAMMGLASTMGLRIRSINHSRHSMCEVLVDGKWYFIENASGRRFTVAEGNFMELVAAPDKVKAYGSGKVSNGFAWMDTSGEELIKIGPLMVLSADQWKMNWAGGGLALPTMFQTLESGYGVSVCMDGNSVRALYPKAETYYLKESPQTGMYTVAGKYGWWHSYVYLKPGQAVRRKVYLGKLNDEASPVTRIELGVLLAPGSLKNFPDYGGDLYIRINGRVRRFEWAGLDWRAETVKVPIPYEVGYMMNPAGLKYVEYDQLRIGMGTWGLKENQINTFEFGLSGPRGAGIGVMIFPDPVLPYNSAYASGAGAPQTNFTIVPDHICEMVEPNYAAFHSQVPHVVKVDWPKAGKQEQAE